MDQMGMDKIKKTRQWNEMTPSSAIGILRTSPVFLILKNFQEQRRKEFCRAFHLHVQKAASMAGAYHSKVRHFHQQFWPEVCNVVLSVIDVVLKRQQEALLALFYSLHADEPWAIWKIQMKDKHVAISPHYL